MFTDNTPNKTNNTLKIAGYHVTIKHFFREVHFGPRPPKFDEDGVWCLRDSSGGPKPQPAPPKSPEAIEDQQLPQGPGVRG